MLATTKRLAALAAVAAIMTACGGESGTSVNRKAPQIIDFYAHPMNPEPGEFILVGWETSNANRIAVSERTGSAGAYVYTRLFESETVVTGYMQYRAHSSIELVLTAYNTNSSSDPVEQVVNLTVEEPGDQHITSLWPDPAYVAPGSAVTIKYSVANVGAGWRLELGTTSGTDTLSHSFDAAAEFLTGEFSTAGCTAASILCIDSHTGYYAELFDAEGTSVEYKETSAGVTAVNLPYVLVYELDPEEISVGSSTTLSWEVHNATNIEILPGVGPQYCVDMTCLGAEVLNPTFSQSYTLTAWGPGGIVVAQRDISVLTTPTPPTVDTFAAAPTEIRPGTTTTLSWTTSLATTVEITAVPADASLPATFSADGSAVVSPTATTTYTITATNTHGNDTDTATVTVTPLAAGDLVISEIMITAATDPAGEWFEIYNPGTMEVNLDGLTLDSGTGESMTVDTDVMIAAGGYALLAASSSATDTDNLPTADYVYSGLTFDTGGADELSVSDGGTVIDTVAWNGSWTVTAAHSLSLTVLTAADNDTFANWCAAGTAWTGATSSFGSPGAAHDDCM